MLHFRGQELLIPVCPCWPHCLLYQKSHETLLGTHSIRQVSLPILTVREHEFKMCHWEINRYFPTYLQELGVMCTRFQFSIVSLLIFCTLLNGKTITIKYLEPYHLACQVYLKTTLFWTITHYLLSYFCSCHTQGSKPHRSECFIQVFQSTS